MSLAILAGKETNQAGKASLQMFRSLFEPPHKRARRLAARQGWAIMEKSESAVAQDNYVSGVAETLSRDGVCAFIALYEREFETKRTLADHARCYVLAEPVATLDWDDAEISLAHAKLKLKLYEQAYAETGQSAAAGALYAKALLTLARLQDTNWIEAMSSAGGEHLAQRAALASDIFRQTAQSASQCPLWHRARFQCAISEGCEAAEVEQRFETALAFDPAEQGLYIERAIQLLPRWYGSFPELETFARRACDSTQHAFGGTLYARIYSAIARHEPLRDTDAGWPRLKESLEAWYGGTRSQQLLNTYAAMADVFGDEDTLAVLLEDRMTAFYPNAWFSGEQAAEVLSRLTPRK